METMQAELRQLIEQSQFHKEPVMRIAALLPAEAQVLDELIAESVRTANQKEFIWITMAALASKRPVSVRHLSRGAMLMPNWLFLGWMAWHMEGELPEPLMDAVQNTQMPLDTEATALFVIAAWCEKHRGGQLPDGFFAAARESARYKKAGKPNEAQRIPTLRAIAMMTKDVGLASVLAQIHGAPNEAGVKRFMELNLIRLTGSAEGELLPATPPKTLAQGTTMRRAVARIGRNEPCPCGSGKKYKHCCHNKDQERLHRSSDVAGHTHEEVAANPEPHLTLARIEKSMPSEILRLDPKKIPPDLMTAYFMQLAGLGLVDRIVEAFEQLDCPQELKAGWTFVLFFMTRAGRRDLLERLIKIHPDSATIENDMKPGARLLLAQDDPEKFVKVLEKLSLDALQEEDSQKLQEFAYGVMESKKLHALGILVSRSMLPLIKPKDASFLFDQILVARDKLNLSPEDPFGDIIDQRFADHEDDDKKEAAQLRKARQNLDTKAHEVRQLKESLAQLQKEITRREKKNVVTNAPAIVAAAGDESALKELRNKVESLKSALKERHHERNDLRRELQKTSSDLEALRQNEKVTTPEEPEALDREEEFLLPQDAPDTHPVRLIEFPKNFQQTLAGVPRHVARATLIMIGRLAGGEPAAFVGALRLKVMPNIMRQRIGTDYRLLFRLHPDHLQVIDLINRKDLDRRLKTLV